MSQMMEEKAARRSAMDISSAMPTSWRWNTSREMGSMLVGMGNCTSETKSVIKEISPQSHKGHKAAGELQIRSKHRAFVIFVTLW